MESDILKMYDLVFQDMVQCYIENLNMDLEENQEYLTITEEEKKTIAYKMIYKNEYLWEIINDTIDTYINDILRERESKENE